MPAIDDLDPRLIAQHGSHPTVSRRHGGERGDRIELTEPGGGFEQVLAGRGDPPALFARAPNPRRQRPAPKAGGAPPGGAGPARPPVPPIWRPSAARPAARPAP